MIRNWTGITVNWKVFMIKKVNIFGITKMPTPEIAGKVMVMDFDWKKLNQLECSIVLLEFKIARSCFKKNNKLLPCYPEINSAE